MKRARLVLAARAAAVAAFFAFADPAMADDCDFVGFKGDEAVFECTVDVGDLNDFDEEEEEEEEEEDEDDDLDLDL